MVAAARLRRAEQRIAHLRPYAGAIRRMTRQAAEAAGRRGRQAADPPAARDRADDRDPARDRRPRPRRRLQLADPARGHPRRRRSYESDGRDVTFYASGRRGVSSLTFREREVAGAYVGFTERPSYADAREIAAGPDDRLRRRQGRPRRHPLQRLRLAPRPGGPPRDAAAAAGGDDPRVRRRRGRRRRGHRPPRAGRVRARARGDPRAPHPRLRRDLALPRAARVDARPSWARA